MTALILLRTLALLSCAAMLSHAAMFEAPDTAFDKTVGNASPFFVTASSRDVEENSPIRDASLAPEEPKPAEGFFANTDSNGDHQLSFDEFLRSDLYYARLKMEEFSRLDTNHDGTISQAEFDAQNTPQTQEDLDRRADYFAQLFQDFDTNFDLKLDSTELLKVLASRFLVKPKREAKFREIFAHFDRNGDGMIDLNEYVKLDAQIPFEEFIPLSEAEIEKQKAEDAQRKTDAAAEEQTTAAPAEENATAASESQNTTESTGTTEH